MSNIEEMPHGYHHDTVNTIIRSNKLQERPGDERIYMLYDFLWDYTLYSYCNYQMCSVEGPICIFSAHLNFNPES